MSTEQQKAAAERVVAGGELAEAAKERDALQKQKEAADNKKKKGKKTRKKPVAPIDPVVENSILSFKLKELVEYRKEEEEKTGKSYYKNIILLNTDEPGILHNNMNSFDPETVAPLLESTSIQLSNFVPTIEVSKVFKNKSTGKEVEIIVPFPEGSVKDDFTQILNQRVGRGGGIGIEYIEWNSMAKNQANLAQWDGKMSIFMQDPGELTKIRNTEVINKEAYSVSLLDFLYPAQNKQGSKEDVINKNRYYDPQEMTLKLKVGWQVNKQKLGDEKVTFDTKASDMFLDALTTTYNITPNKHELNFGKDGSLRLEITFIATAIALLDDTRKSDIFYKEEYIKNLHKEFDSKLDIYDQQLKKETANLKNLTKRTKAWWKKVRQIKKIKNNIKITGQNRAYNEKKEKMRLFHSFLQFLNTKNLMYYYVVTKEEKERLKKLREIKGGELDITTKEGKDNLELLIKSTTKTKESSTEQPNLSSLTDFKTVRGPFPFLRNPKNPESIKNNLDSKKIEDLYYKSIKENYSKKQKGSVVVPYFYLGDMLEFFFQTKVLNREGKASRTLADKDSRLVLGTFKFSDYGNPHVSLSEGGPAPEIKKLISEGGEEEKTIEITLKSDTVVANIAHIPISFKSFVAWFNKNIMSTNLKVFSIHKLLTDSINDLVSMNLSNKILVGSKQISVELKMQQEIIDERVLTNDNKDIPTYLNNIFKNKKNYIINYDEKNDNPFKRINSKKAALENSKSEKEMLNPENVAYYFITSAREGTDSLNGDYNVDIQRNIYHFFLGDERGLLRDVSFSRADNPNFRAHQMSAANMGNDSGILRAVYNANIDLYGNNIFVPGMSLYINPSYPGMRLQDPILLDIGLGGYYVINTVTNKIQPGLYTTSLQANWEAYGKVPELDLSKKGDISSLRQIIESNKISNIKIE